MAAVYQKTCDVTEKLRSMGHEVLEMWEHTFAHMKKEDPALKAFANQHSIVERLNPKDAFFGGRTNAVRLFYEGDAKYVDFTSLYPWVSIVIYNFISFFPFFFPVLSAMFVFVTGEQVLCVPRWPPGNHHAKL